MNESRAERIARDPAFTSFKVVKAYAHETIYRVIGPGGKVVAITNVPSAAKAQAANFNDIFYLGVEHAERKTNAWRPMSTAPKDGTEVLLSVESRAGIPGKCLVGHWMPGGHCIEDHPPIDSGWYFWNGCSFDKASKPTHWMPLPKVPVPGPQSPPRPIHPREVG